MSIKIKKRAADAEHVREAAGRLRAWLADRGLRLTRQRRAIVEAVADSDGHFDAEELYDAFHARGIQMSRATVYRTLGHLRQCGMVREAMQRGGRARYEATCWQAHHDHLVCVNCGRVIEFCDERIEQLQDGICERHGFEPVEHHLSIRGLCRKCARARRNRRGG